MNSKSEDKLLIIIENILTRIERLERQIEEIREKIQQQDYV